MWLNGQQIDCLAGHRPFPLAGQSHCCGSCSAPMGLPEATLLSELRTLLHQALPLGILGLPPASTPILPPLCSILHQASGYSRKRACSTIIACSFICSGVAVVVALRAKRSTCPTLKKLGATRVVMAHCSCTIMSLAQRAKTWQQWVHPSRKAGR